MRALLIDGAPLALLLGLSPWILPLIAIAAKRKAYDGNAACCARLLRGWLRMNRNAGDATPEDGAPAKPPRTSGSSSHVTRSGAADHHPAVDAG